MTQRTALFIVTCFTASIAIGAATADDRDHRTLDAPAPAALAIEMLPKSTGYYRIPYADGTDVKVSRDHNSHTPKGRYDMSGKGGSKPYKIVAAAPGRIVAIEDGFSASQDSDTAPQCNNNYVWIEHPNGEWTKYSHMLKNSTTGKAKLKVGDNVKAGQYLGDEGAVGCASGDHLHFEVGDPWATDPFTAVGGFLRDNAGSKRNRIARMCSIPNGVFAAGQTYKARNVPTMLTAGSKEVARHGLPIGDYQCLFDQAVAANYEPVWINIFNAGGKTFVNAIFRPQTPGDFRAFHGLSAAQYQAEFNEWTGKGYRPVIVESYLEDGVRYAAVFKHKAGPAYAAYHGLDAAAHQSKLDSLTAEGYRPVSISVVSNGGRKYTALYEKQNVGGWQAKSQLTPAEYQTFYNSNKQAGRSVAYLNAYNHGGARLHRRHLDVADTGWRQAAPRHDQRELPAGMGQRARRWHADEAVAGYATGASPTYAASWRK